MEQWNTGFWNTGFWKNGFWKNGNVGYCKIHLDRELNK
jgi:hypothetical protein